MLESWRISPVHPGRRRPDRRRGVRLPRHGRPHPGPLAPRHARRPAHPHPAGARRHRRPPAQEPRAGSTRRGQQLSAGGARRRPRGAGGLAAAAPGDDLRRQGRGHRGHLRQRSTRSTAPRSWCPTQPDGRPARPERRRQDHAVRRHLRPAQAEPRHGLAVRPGRHQDERVGPLPARDGPHLPDHPRDDRPDRRATTCSPAPTSGSRSHPLLFLAGWPGAWHAAAGRPRRRPAPRRKLLDIDRYWNERCGTLEFSARRRTEIGRCLLAGPAPAAARRAGRGPGPGLLGRAVHADQATCTRTSA